MSDRKKALLDRIDQMENAEPWRAEVGSTLVGEVQYVDFRSTEFDPDCPVIGILDDNDGLWEVYGFGAVLKGQILKHKPQLGEWVAIKRSEDRVSASTRKPYKCFTFTVDRQTTKAVDWDRVSPESGDVPAEEARELTHEEITRKLMEEDRQRGPRPVEKKDPPSGEIADDDFKAPWETDDD